MTAPQTPTPCVHSGFVPTCAACLYRALTAARSGELKALVESQHLHHENIRLKDAPAEAALEEAAPSLTEVFAQLRLVADAAVIGRPHRAMYLRKLCNDAERELAGLRARKAP